MHKLIITAITLLFVFTKSYSQPLYENQSEVESQFLTYPNSETFKNHLKELTKAPHPAGSEESKAVINYMKTAMENAGLEVDLYDYDIYFPEKPGINEVEIVSPVQVTLNNKEIALEEDPFSSDSRISHGWNSFSGNGEVTAEIVYANYARKEDFEKLEELGIDVSGKIVLARYGGNFRGFKAKYAEAAGAAGLIIYTDPSDAGYMRGFVYPEGQFYSENTIQRGSVLTLDYTGDPLTPFEPALPLDGKEKIERLDPKDVAFHTIPVTPIGYGAAQQIMENMKGTDAVPSGWQGGLPFTYRLEGGPDLKVRLRVEQEKKFNRVTNVVGTLEGSEYPDEWIIIGAHHDPWTFGASDPNSGTAMLLSLAESLSKLSEAGFRPKRTIKIAHWDAEEHGILGSAEWVEQLAPELREKAVAYFNADGAVSGPNFGAAASPSLKSALISATKKVDHPKNDGTVYDAWTRNGELEEPRIGNLGGGSDHVAFYTHVGVPSMSAGSGGPTLYHSGYDDFYWYSTFADPDFVFGPMVESVFGIMALELANSPIIPYDLNRYADDLKTHTNFLVEKYYADSDSESHPFEKLLSTADELSKAATSLHQQIESKNGTLKKKQLKEINQKLIALEKNWIYEEGMPFGKWSRSLFGAPDPFSGYASWMLPGLRYYLDIDEKDKIPEWEDIYTNHVSQLEQSIKELSSSME